MAIEVDDTYEIQSHKVKFLNLRGYMLGEYLLNNEVEPILLACFEFL